MTLFEKIKLFFSLTWTYVCLSGIVICGFIVYVYKNHVSTVESGSPQSTPTTHTHATVFFNALTPKFYVALTGTSSLISGLILIFEWWYFKKYGTSFIEQVSLNYIANGSDAASQPTSTSLVKTSSMASSTSSSLSLFTDGDASSSSTQSVPECKVWKNPMSLLRGPEYSKLTASDGREPLTFYDMNLSAQDHQTFFSCETDEGKPDYEIMQRAWRERNQVTRIMLAHEALELNAESTPALILLAEEEAQTIIESEKGFKLALKYAELAYKKSLQAQEQGHNQESIHKRNTNILIFIKRRIGMCARKLGKLKEAIKIFRDLVKEFPMMSVYNIHENLIEALLETQSYADVQVVLAKYDDINLPKSATICYTAALLKARAVSDKFSPDTASKRGLTPTEISAVDAIHRAVEFNPHVPKYLLEMKSLIFPPEHILKRGDSEALAYAFFHLQHWKKVENALNILTCTWEGTFRIIPYPLEKGHLFHPYPSCTETADRELLPNFHEISVFPKKELPFFIIFTAGLCSGTASLALITHLYPEYTTTFVRLMLQWFSVPLSFLSDKIETALPVSLMQTVSKV
jgi:hypothetical protein